MTDTETRLKACELIRLQTTDTHRYKCTLDLSTLRDKDRIVLHAPAHIYTRLCKGSVVDADSKEIHIYIGKKNNPKAGREPKSFVVSQKVSVGGGASANQSCQQG
jgi:hypothetical protein